jgi:hypothetical protein
MGGELRTRFARLDGLIINADGQPSALERTRLVSRLIIAEAKLSTLGHIDDALHRTTEIEIRGPCRGQRTGVINQIRAFLLERGIAVRQGLRSLRSELPGTRRGLREDETTMEDRSSRRMRTLVTRMARSRPVH